MEFFCNVVYRDEQPPAQDVGAENSETLPGGLSDADIDSNWDEAIESFDAMDLPEELLRGIYAYGFEKPSAIQQRAIKPTILGRDLIAQAQSGTVSGMLYISNKRNMGWLRKQGMMKFVNHHLSSLKRVTLDVSENRKYSNISDLM